MSRPGAAPGPEARPLAVAFVATKAPWPPIDGGRQLMVRTLEGLAARGVRVTVFAPVPPGSAAEAAHDDRWDVRFVPVERPSTGAVVARSAATGLPLSPSRHRHPEVEKALDRHLASEVVDLVHAEQVQALPQALGPCRRHGVPLLLRCQNVESRMTAAFAPRWLGPLAALERWRYRRWEGRALAAADRVAALSHEDADELTGLVGTGLRRPVEVVRVPFPAELPAGPRQDGEPAVALFSGAGWAPNRHGAQRFLEEVWPAVLQALPRAVLHVFGPVASPASGGPRIVEHPAPLDSVAAFPGGAILVVPMAEASGVRIKILEAWARGVPVVASTAAARGLEARNGEELLLADGVSELVAALERLHRLPSLRDRLVAAGRAQLRDRHAPAEITERLIRLYRAAIGA